MAPTEPDPHPGPDRAPLPPDWLAGAALPLTTLPAGTTLHRVHRAAHAPLFFGPGPGEPPRSRFDAPAGEFRTLYLACGLAGAFVETLLRNPALRLVAREEVTKRRWSLVRCAAPLRLVRLLGEGLSALGTTAAVSTGPYAVSRAWALALWRHRERPDGILYLSRHDTDQHCVALFDRPGLPLEAAPPEPFDEAWLAATLRRYGKCLEP